jgi:hypothetical protein
MARLLASLLFLITGSAFAQAPIDAAAAQRDAIGKLGWMVGRWEGGSTFILPDGPLRARSVDTVQVVAGGTALVFRARHYRIAAGGGLGEMLQDIVALISFNAARQGYLMNVHSLRGSHFEVEATLQGGVLGFDLPTAEGPVRVTMGRNAAGQFTEQSSLCREPARCDPPAFTMALDRTGDAP